MLGRGSAPTVRRSNWNSEVLVLEEGGKQSPNKKRTKQGENSQLTVLWRLAQDSNLGHIGGKEAYWTIPDPIKNQQETNKRPRRNHLRNNWK